MGHGLVQDFDLTEILNGEERVGPSPFGSHQRIIQNLLFEIRSFLEKSPIGEVFVSPLDVILEEGVNRLQPDLLFISSEHLTIVQDWVRGVPDLVVEVVSPGTVSRDSVEKKAIYERYCVPEFWLVYPEQRCIEFFVITEGRYILHASSEQTELLASKILAGFSLNPRRIFPG